MWLSSEGVWVFELTRAADAASGATTPVALLVGGSVFGNRAKGTRQTCGHCGRPAPRGRLWAVGGLVPWSDLDPGGGGVGD